MPVKCSSLAQGDKFAATVVLPAPGVPLSEATAAAASLPPFQGTDTLVELHLPKFSLQSQYDLKPCVSTLKPGKIL